MKSSENLVAYDRSKHIEIIYYYFMDSLRSEIHRPSKPNRRVSLINFDYNNLRVMVMVIVSHNQQLWLWSKVLLKQGFDVEH